MKLIKSIATFSLAIIVFWSCNYKVENITSRKDIYIDSLLSVMTIEEKIGQLTLFTSDWDQTGPTLRENYKEDIRSGKCGNIFNAHTVAYNHELQKIAVEETRLGIPLLFGYDVIHGYKTQFPVPIAEASSWDLELIEKSARLSAKEATAGGLNWTFNPMVDISRDPRWGRVVEGAGEDPYLASLIAKAKVKGYQGESLNNPYTLAACMKHYAAYGAPEAGRDYNTVNMSERMLREIYLPPFQAAVEVGVASVMTAFNEVNGIPASGNKFLLRDILRDEWGFEGVVVTDYSSIMELTRHGFAEDEKNAGEIALNAGVDMDMQSAIYYNYLEESLEENKVSIENINQAVRNIINLKYDLGLFDKPYMYFDLDKEKEIIHSEEMMQHALESAKKSIVLLKNEEYKGNKLLPLSNKVKSIAVIGPLANNQSALLGSWHAAGDASRVVSLVEGLKNKFPDKQINFAEGCGFDGNDKTGFLKAIQLAKKSDLIIMAIGENHTQNGEAASRSEIGLPGVQQDLLEEITKIGKPVVSLVMAGRPLTIQWMTENVPAIIYAWHLGTRSGDAIAAVLSGDYNPSAKLVMTFPRNVGQIPIYYNFKNTGRPFNKNDKYTTKYLDVSNDPLYPFGFGLSYSEFEYENLELSTNEISFEEELIISLKVTNTSKIDGEEIVQLYVRDMVATVTRPVKELKDFKKINIKAGESKEVSFSINAEKLKFYDANMNHVAENGLFKVFVGTNSSDVLSSEFNLIEQ